MTAVDPEGRIRHPLDVFHSTLQPDGDFVPAGYVPMADGLGQVEYVDSSTLGGGSLDLAGDTGTAATVDDITFIGAGGIAVDVNDLGGGAAEVTIDGSGVSGGGGGGLTHSYVGYNTIGASVDTPGVNGKVYIKKITLAADGFLASIGAYLSSASGSSVGPIGRVYSDNAGTPDQILAFNAPTGPVMNLSGGARWIHVPMGVWLTAADYWIGIRTTDAGGAVVMKLNYDTGGSDRTGQETGGNIVDWANIGSAATTSNRYSIRASVIT